ncbi:MAG: hypothetical protein ACPL3P_00120 [Anaerolineales bacterium]
MPLFIASVCLGLALSIRVGALLALFIICVFGYLRSGKRALIPLFLYIAISFVVMYIAWPALWGDPITTFRKSLEVMSNFPYHGDILFLGKLYESGSTPWYYPTLLIFFQFTEPLILLLIISMIFIISRKIELNQELLLLIVFWFLLPLAAIILRKSILYDNFRQLFFLIPPIFLIAGLALDWFFNYFALPIYKLILVIFLFFPSIFGIISLHPYEYTYYNALVGWNHGAFRKFEMDYWRISYREAINYINQIAPRDAKVVVWESPGLVNEFARKDLVIFDRNAFNSAAAQSFDYLIVPTRNNKDLNIYPNIPSIYTIERQGAILALIKHLADEQNP